MNLNIPKEPVIVYNEDFQTIIVRVMFPYEEKEENLAKISLLPNLLSFMNNRYKTEEEFQINKKKNYILSTNCNRLIVGTTHYLCFSIVIPDSKVLGFNNLDKQFEFLKEMIYNPKIDDDGFISFELEREKTNLNMSIDNNMKKLGPYHSIRSLELIDDEGILSRCVENHREQIDDITSRNLYDFYMNILKEYRPAIFVFGNVNKNEINSLCDKYLYNDYNGKTVIKKNYNHFLKVKNHEVKLVEEDSNFKDSALSFFYKIDNFNEDDFNCLSILNALLSSLSSRLLDKTLRDENDLVYSSRTLSYQRYGVFEITTYINKDNKDIVIEKIREVMESIKKPENINDFLANIKERKRLGLIKMLDDKFTLFNDYIMEVLEISKSTKDIYNEVLEITSEDISKFVDRLVLDTIYFIKEESHE